MRCDCGANRLPCETQIINRVTACAPDAAPPQQHYVARWQRASGRTSVPGVGAVALKVTQPARVRNLQGPLCVRMVYALSNVRPSPHSTPLSPGPGA